MVERAPRPAEYSQLEVNRGLPAAELVQHFERSRRALARSRQALRRNVTFQRLNLAAPLPALRPFDVIFLRNVLIYFDVPTKQPVLQQRRQLLRPDGWLFLGAAETTIGIDDNSSGWRRPDSAYRPHGAAHRPARRDLSRCAPW